MDVLRFFVNDRAVEVRGLSPNTTLLEWLRREARLTGTNEGCAEGDCGACTVVLLDPDAEGGPRLRAVNSCLVLLPMVAGRRVWTVEGLAGAGAEPHPAQQAMVETLGSQCGYCTPGVVMSLAEACHRQDLDAEWQLDDQLCGNLCRCTGYRPIRDAAGKVAGTRPDDVLARALAEAPTDPRPAGYLAGAARFFLPATFEALFDHLEADPEARLVAGGTDVSLEITKAHRHLPALVSLEALPALKQIVVAAGETRFGAAVALTDLEAATAESFPPIHRMLRFFGSRQIKHRATLGGNLANASPIGDLAPVLLALGATAVIRGRHGRREVPLDRFFLGYRQTALEAGELLEAVRVPALPASARAAAYKVSKRRELDISAVALGAYLEVDDAGAITVARLGFGGLAEIPKRAAAAEQALLGRPVAEEATFEAAAEAVDADFAPIDDHRASGWYRRTVAANLLRGFGLELARGRLPALPDRPTATVLPEVAP